MLEYDSIILRIVDVIEKPFLVQAIKWLLVLLVPNTCFILITICCGMAACQTLRRTERFPRLPASRRYILIQWHGVSNLFHSIILDLSQDSFIANFIFFLSNVFPSFIKAKYLFRTCPIAHVKVTTMGGCQ